MLFELVVFLKRYMGGLSLILSDRLLVISATRPLVDNVVSASLFVRLSVTLVTDATNSFDWFEQPISDVQRFERQG